MIFRNSSILFFVELVSVPFFGFAAAVLIRILLDKLENQVYYIGFFTRAQFRLILLYLCLIEKH